MLHDLDPDDEDEGPEDFISMPLVHKYGFTIRYLLERDGRPLRGVGFLPRDREDYE